MTATVATVFAIVYVGMILGGLPFLQLDRTGVALLGAIAIVGLEVLTPEQAALSIHLPTLLLLFSFMVLSAQMRLGGFYTWVTLRIAALPLAPPMLLAATMAAVAALSAVFSNDVVCLAVAPVLADACARRRLDPVPYLIGLACAANIGSAATLIGNPQNMLIGQVLGMHFAAYLRAAFLPALLGLAAAWGSLPGVFLPLQKLCLQSPRGVKANTRGSIPGRPPRGWRWPARRCWGFCSPTGRARSPRSPERAS